MVIGNQQKEINKEDFGKIAGGFRRVEIDLGTGDGRFIFKNALVFPEVLFIGIDPAEKQLQIYSKKALRRKLNNALFVVGSTENLPCELLGSANKIYITLPWGTLLENIVKPTKEKVLELGNLLKGTGQLEITFGYAPELEPSETKRLELPEINMELIEKVMVPVFELANFHLKNLEEIDKEGLKNLETTWAKKLKFGKDRKIYRVVFEKLNTF